MQFLDSWLNMILGLQAPSLTASHMICRAVVVYLVTWLMIRVVGDRRFAGKYAAIDIILSITLGATLSRAINGSAAFFPTLVAGGTLVSLHWVLAALTFRIPQLELWFKGRARTLIRQGEIDAPALKKSHLTQQDLMMALRTKGCSTEVDQVTLATLEPNGEISVLPRSSVHVFELPIEDGLKTIRVVIE